jgi:hypothetical protein
VSYALDELPARNPGRFQGRSAAPTRTRARYATAVGTWHGPGPGRPIAAPLERCTELLGVDLATVREAAANVEPYLRAGGTEIWSLMQLERQLRHGGVWSAAGRLHRPSTDPAAVSPLALFVIIINACAGSKIGEQEARKLTCCLTSKMRYVF